MSDIAQLFELGQAIISSVFVVLAVQMLFNTLYAHPRNSRVLKRSCTFLRDLVSKFCLSGKHESFLFRKLVFPALSGVTPYTYDSCATLKTILLASSAVLNPIAKTEAIAEIRAVAPSEAKTDGHAHPSAITTDKKDISTLDIESIVDKMTPNQWIQPNHPIHSSANQLRSSLKQGIDAFETALASWKQAKREMDNNGSTPSSNAFSLDLAECYSFGSETIMHFRFFKITAVVFILSGIPLLYNVSVMDVPFVANQNFSISDYNIAALPQGSKSLKSTCHAYFALYLFPLFCDWCVGGICLPVACYNTSIPSGCKSGPSLAKDFWSDVFTVGISPADCRPPWGTYEPSLGYCECSDGYLGTVCRSGAPATAAYGFFFMAATLISVFAWIFMVRARESVSAMMKERLCPQVRDFSILIQDLPPNSHLNRNELCSFLSKKFGPVKFLSFAFDDRKLFDGKEALGNCRDTLEEMANSNFDYQTQLISNKVLTENEVATADFEVIHDFEGVKQWAFKRDSTEILSGFSGFIKKIFRFALPHPSIGFVLAPHFIYRKIYGENIPLPESRGFPTVLRLKGASNPAMPESVDTIIRVGVVEYFKSFKKPSASIVQWQALQATMSILECQSQECQNSGTAICTFERSCDRDVALRLNSRVVCQARDQRSAEQSRHDIQQRSPPSNYNNFILPLQVLRVSSFFHRSR
jgi:hypothetical protein